MLSAGDSIPADATVWLPDATATTLGDALDGDGLALACFYPFDWSST